MEKLKKEKRVNCYCFFEGFFVLKGSFLRTGSVGLDSLFSNGVPVGCSVIIEGGPGSGKTVFCLNLAHNFAKAGLKTLYMSFEEPEERLVSHTINFGWNVQPLMDKGLLRIKRFSALDIARSVEALLTEAKKELLIDVQPILIPKDFVPDVVLIDSLTAISSAFSGEKYRFRIYMEQLFRYLENNKITSFLIRETPRPTHLGGGMSVEDEAVSFLSDGIICVYSVFYDEGKRGRAIEVLKMRGEEFESKIVELQIVNKQGVVVNPNKIISGKYTLT